MRTRSPNLKEHSMKLKRVTLTQPPQTCMVSPRLRVRKSKYRYVFRSLSLAKSVLVTQPPSQREIKTMSSSNNVILNSWNFIFDHKVSPLRHIPDVAVRHYVLQILGLIWAVSFSAAIGSYVFLAASIIGHVILIAAAAITIATLTTAAKNPKLFSRGAGRRNDGEHE